MTIDEILECLERRRIRATYGAVAEVLNTANGTSYIARGVSVLLGERRPRASWVVSSQDLEPTEYSPQEKHPELYRYPHAIKTGLRKCRSVHPLSSAVSAGQAAAETGRELSRPCRRRRPQ